MPNSSLLEHNPRFREHKIVVFVRLTLRGACAIVDCSRDDPAEDAPTWVAAGDTRRKYGTARNNRGDTAAHYHRWHTIVSSALYS